jgi:putative membrane protein
MSDPSLPSLLISHWQLPWSLAVEAGAGAGLYTWATARVRGRWPIRRTISFLGGLGCLLVALGSGLDAYDDELLSVHMVQHMLLLMVVPALLLEGQPVLLALRTLPRRRRRTLARALTRARPYFGPVPSLVFFSAVIVLTHLPSFYDATLRHAALHDCEHALYVISGLLAWWHILDVDPVPSHRLGGLGKLGYLLAAMAPMALVGAYLNRHATLVYPAYGPPARELGVSALDDQSVAGAIMWVVGDVIMVAVGLWAIVAALVAAERRQQAQDAREDAAAAMSPSLAGPDGSLRG